MRYFAFFGLILLMFSNLVFSQVDTTLRGYFIFPINQGKQNAISGTLGEIRKDHFHTGLDIKTNGEIGWPVVASADGFISRIKSGPFGYGLALYMTHTNGYHTTYAHLSTFVDTLNQYTLKKQYELKKFDVDFELPKNLFSFKKGDTIGFSGNSGSSGGPHLHWEIRDPWQVPLNPLIFGFPEVVDKIKPAVYAISLTPFTINSHVENSMSDKIFNPREDEKGDFFVKDTIYAQGVIGLAVKAIDKLNGAENQNGIVGLDLYMDDKRLFSYYQPKISFEEKRYVNAHIDYNLSNQGFGDFHKCYLDEGNVLKLYQKDENKGKIIIKDDKIHQVYMEIYDAYGNRTNLKFLIKGAPLKSSKYTIDTTAKQKISYEINHNVLITKCTNCEIGVKPLLFNHLGVFEIPLSYTENNSQVFVCDMHKMLPDSIKIGSNVLFSKPYSLIPGTTDFTYIGKNYKIEFGNRSLYDTMYLQSTYQNNVFEFGNPNTPIHEEIVVYLKSNKVLPEKTSVYRIDNSGNFNYIATSYDPKTQYYRFKTRKFGTFTLKSDNSSAKIQYIGKTKKGELKFKISDNLSGLKKYEVFVGSQWIMLEYYPDDNIFISKRLDASKPFVGLVEVQVVDNEGNTVSSVFDVTK